MTSPTRIALAALALSAPRNAAAQPVEPAPTPVPGGDEVRWTYDEGFTATAGDELELELGLRTQTRFEVTRLETTDELEGRFALQRIRLQLEGHAFGEANAYKIEFDLANRGFSVIKDFFVERAFLPAFRLRVGQWKKPFSRQELTSDYAQAFADRSPVGEVTGAGRDLGLMLHSGYERSPDGAEWALGVFNGTGDKPSQKLTCPPPADPADPIDPADCTIALPTNVPRDLSPELVARVGWNQGGIKGYRELDLEGGPLRFAAGASYRVRLHDLVDADRLEHGAEVDAIIKAYGFELTGAAFLIKKGEEDAGFGGYAQADYLLVPERLAVGGRVGVAPVEGRGTHRIEYLGALDLLAHGHGYKLVLDGGVVHDTGEKTDDVVAHAQAQLVF
jgi:hypothetical protein